MKTCLISSFQKQSGIANYSKDLQSHSNCDIFPWDFYNKISITFSPIKNFFKLRKLAKDNDLVHVQYHLGEQGPLFLPILWLLPGRWVVTLHEDHKNFPLSGFWVWWHNLWLKRADALLVHTEVHKNVLSKDLRGKTSVVPFGVNIRKTSEFKDHTIIIPGFINRWKGHDIAIKAMPEVLKHFPDSELHIVGKVWDNKFLGELNQMVKNLKLESCVFINSEFVSEEQYAEYLKCAHVVVLPYHNITMSAVLADAIGSGKEVVLSNISPFEEYSKGMLHSFEKGNDSDLSDQIIRVFNGARCDVSKLANMYSWPKIAKQHLVIYDLVVKGENSEKLINFECSIL